MLKRKRATKSSSPKMRELTAREIYLRELVIGSAVIEVVKSNSAFTILGARPQNDKVEKSDDEGDGA
jgi:hypothetical protein